MLLACQRRKVYLSEFFSHENQSYPLSLSDGGNIRIPSAKSDLVGCLVKDIDPTLKKVTSSPPSSCVIVDGASVAQATRPIAAMTFGQYATNRFQPEVTNIAKHHGAIRVDVMFDRYFKISIKAAARLNRGESHERKVKADMRMLKTGMSFF